MAISLKVSGISYTLPAAQLRSLVHTTQANAPARLAGEIYRSAIPTCDWAAGDSVELWVDGTRRFAGWLGPVEMGCDAGRSYVAIQAEDILGRLRGTTFTRYGAEIAGYDASGAPIYSAGASRQSAVTLFSGQLSATDPVSDYFQYVYNSSSATQIAEVIGLAALAYPGALALGTLTGLSERNLPEKVTDMDCLSVLQRCLALRPDAVLWVDPSGATPLLHAAVRSALTPVSVSVAPGNTAVRAWSCRDRSDRLLEYLSWTLLYTYRYYTATSGGVYGETAPESTVSSQSLRLLYTYGDATAQADKRHIRRFNLGTYAPVYTSGAQLGTPMAQFPVTAAADFWAANSVLHYEGAVTLYEPAGCSYAWALGQTLSLTGAAAAYESANALVRGCTYDIVSGQTSIDFGPPDQLGPGDLLNGASSLGGLTLGGITPRPTDTKTEDPAQADGGTGEAAGEQADTLTQRIQDKLGSFALQAGSGFQMATMDVTATVLGWVEFGTPSVPPATYCAATPSGIIHRIVPSYTWNNSTSDNFAGTLLVSKETGLIIAPSPTYRVTHDATGSWYKTYWGPSPSPTGGYNDPRGYGALRPAFCDNMMGGYSDQRTITTSADEAVVEGTGVELYGIIYTGTFKLKLSDKDTDADARARAQAAASWSAWTAFASALNGAAAWQTVRTTGWSSSAHLAKIKATTLRSNIWGYPGRVSIPIYRYAIGATPPSAPTSTQTFDIYFVDTLENIAAEGEAAVWQHVGVATMPEWELPCEQGFINLAGQPTVSLQ